MRQASGWRGKIPLSSRQADAGLVTVAAGVRLLPFAPVDWVDIVDTAPTVLPSADTAAMLFWALLASGQINMRKIDGWQTLATKPIDQHIDLAA